MNNKPIKLLAECPCYEQGSVYSETEKKKYTCMELQQRLVDLFVHDKTTKGVAYDQIAIAVKQEMIRLGFVDNKKQPIKIKKDFMLSLLNEVYGNRLPKRARKIKPQPGQTLRPRDPRYNLTLAELKPIVVQETIQAPIPSKPKEKIVEVYYQRKSSFANRR